MSILALMQGHNVDFLQARLRELQQVRNFSFLEHGYSTVDQRVAEKQVEAAYSLAIEVLSSVEMAEGFDALVKDLHFV